MLDGASAFIPVPVPASAYADHLARQIARLTDNQPGGDLRGILADAIAATARDLDLQAGKSPSSTVIILRHWGSTPIASSWVTASRSWQARQVDAPSAPGVIYICMRAASHAAVFDVNL